MIKIGIISFAHMHAYSYAEAIKESNNTELVAITDEDEERGKSLAQKYDASYYASYTDMLKTNMDAVIVTSENSYHCKHVVAAAQAGKHILCEKPMATTICDAKKMIEACEVNKVKLQIAYPVRFNASVVQAKRAIDNGEIGRVLAIRGTNRGVNPGGWFMDPKKSGGGAVMDHTVHVVDVLRWIMKSEVKEVYAEVDQLFNQQDYNIDDAAIMIMEFNNGVFATLDASFSRNKDYPNSGDVIFEIVGTKGTISVDGFNQNLRTHVKEDGATDHFFGYNMNVGLIQDFVNALIKDRTPSISGEDGLRALEVIVAAYESAKNEEIVQLV